MSISINDIKLYFLNPKKYTGSKTEIQEKIKEIDEFLLSNGENEADSNLFSFFQTEFTSENDLKNPIISAIHKTLADNQGLSSTRNYREIHFNEIIQNANDLPSVNEITITLSLEENNYIVSFEYNDVGFSVENLIGFFDTEFHIKKKNLSSTGKHGVGIKSLFYFVNKLSIESNVNIEFCIDTVDNNDGEQGIKVSSKLEYNHNQQKKDKTILTISFEKDKSDCIYNIKKLQKFIDACLNNQIDDSSMNQYFFSDKQKELIFDARNLLFTDKNKNKDSGIKNITFKTSEKELFTISCDTEDENIVSFSDIKICKSIVKYNDEKKYEYLIFTRLFEDDKKQNFSIAFPTGRLNGCSRFYETYYIPDEEYKFNLPLLINSKHSNVSRTKLTDGNQNEKDTIIKEIQDNINLIYEIMCREDVAISVLKTDISKLFHKLLNHPCVDNNEAINIVNADVNNKYLQKYNTDTDVTNGKYIVFKREQKEIHEKILVGSTTEDKENLKSFYDMVIVQDDSLVFNEDIFLDEAKVIYYSAFNNNDFKLKKILNIAGKVRDLFYYRIVKEFPLEENSVLSDEMVDSWHNLYSKDTNQIDISFKMLGRYKLHQNIDISGTITGASFFEYLFNDYVDTIAFEVNYPTFSKKQSALFGEEYSQLKKRLYELLINREATDCQGEVFVRVSEKYRKENYWCKEPDKCFGNICFYGSSDTRASSKLFYECKEHKIYDYQENCNTDTFGRECSLLLAKKLLEDSALKNIFSSFFDKLVIMDNLLPLWAKPTEYYWRDDALSTGEPFKRRIININFMKQIYAHSWEDFKFYYLFVAEFQKDKDINLYTIKGKKPLFNFDVNELPEMFKFFYNENIRNNIEFKVNLVGELKNNLCNEEFFDFIKQLTEIEVFVTETNKIDGDRKHQIMYLYSGDINFYNSDSTISSVKGKYENDKNDNAIYIVHGSTIDTKIAIIKVLEQVLGKTDIIDFCKAFIPSENFRSVSGEQYSNITNREIPLNNLSQQFSAQIDIRKLNCKDMLKIILARGNNNGCCSCCGKKIDEDAKLVIVKNQDESTQNEHPKIYTATCSECRDILGSSLYKAEITSDEKTIKFILKISNCFQEKKIIIKCQLLKGTLFNCSSESPQTLVAKN